MVESDVKLNSKTVIITGCNTGIGYETVLDLSARGARVIMACRDIAKAEAAKAKVYIIYRTIITLTLFWVAGRQICPLFPQFFCTGSYSKTIHLKLFKVSLNIF